MNMLNIVIKSKHSLPKNKIEKMEQSLVNYYDLSIKWKKNE